MSKAQMFQGRCAHCLHFPKAAGLEAVVWKDKINGIAEVALCESLPGIRADSQ
jgi:hypothetical protein